jgi:nucleoside-diphosphate-sugar epimerase
MKVLITGAAGYLGCKIYQPFEEKHQLRLMDIKPFESKHEIFVGDVADLEACRKAVKGMDAMLIAHMAPRQAGAYETPPPCFDANVKGTANLFFAGIEAGVKRYVVISTTGVFMGYGESASVWMRDMKRKPIEFYGLTKMFQEEIGEMYARVHKVSVSVIRFPWVMHADSMIGKYGQKRQTYGEGMSDPWDIGNAARLALERDDIAFEIFHVIGTSEEKYSFDVAYTKKRLGWAPKYDFKWLPTEEQTKQQTEKKS